MVIRHAEENRWMLEGARRTTGTFSHWVVAKRKDIAGPRFESVVISAKCSLPRIRVFTDREHKMSGRG